jgi:hypothetical protein
MPANSKFLAWIEPSHGRECVAAFVGAASDRKPATHRCASPMTPGVGLRGRQQSLAYRSNGWTSPLRPRTRLTLRPPAAPPVVSVRTLFNYCVRGMPRSSSSSSSSSPPR